jgi:hypothetical protein
MIGKNWFTVVTASRQSLFSGKKRLKPALSLPKCRHYEVKFVYVHAHLSKSASDSEWLKWYRAKSCRNMSLWTGVSSVNSTPMLKDC